MNGSNSSAHDNIDLNSLSKEDLLRFIAEQNRVLKAKDEEIDAQKRELKEKEREITAKDKIISERGKEIDKLLDDGKRLICIGKIMNEGLIALKENCAASDKYVILLNDMLSRDTVAKAAFFTSETLRWASTAQSYLKETPFAGSGNDLGAASSVAEGAKTAASELKKVNTSLKNHRRYFTRVIGAVEKLAQETKDSDLSSTLSAVKEIIGIKPKHRTAKDTNTDGNTGGKGRVAKDRFGHTKKKTSSGSTQNLSCPSHPQEKLEPMGRIAAKLLTQNINERHALEKLTNINDVYVCPKCGTCKIAYTKAQDFPVIPNRIIGMNILAIICDCLCHGIPAQRYYAQIKEYEELGGDTLSYNLHDFVGIYLNPIYDMIYAKAKEHKVILADETPFPCLQEQGRGKLSEEQKESILNGDTSTHSKNYIETLSSPLSAVNPLVYYRYMPSRSDENISNIITPDFKFKYLVADGYQSYKNILNHNRKLQSCWVHVRRAFIKALNPEELGKTYDKLSDEEVIAEIKKQYQGNSYCAAMLTLFTGVSKLYELEYSIDQTQKGWEEKLQENRKQSLEVITAMDKVIAAIAPELTEKTKSGAYRAKASGNNFAKAVVYYLNQRPYLSTYLEDINITPDSNIVEGHIRPIAVIRKAIDHKVNPDYLQDLCVIYTVFRTAQLNGIKDIITYLHDYCCALHIYCKEKRYGELLKDGFDLGKQVKSWDMKALSQGFDFEKYNVFTYAK